jgi:hypothetical protein
MVIMKHVIIIFLILFSFNLQSQKDIWLDETDSSYVVSQSFSDQQIEVSKSDTTGTIDSLVMNAISNLSDRIGSIIPNRERRIKRHREEIKHALRVKNQSTRLINKIANKGVDKVTRVVLEADEVAPDRSSMTASEMIKSLNPTLAALEDNSIKTLKSYADLVGASKKGKRKAPIAASIWSKLNE